MRGGRRSPGCVTGPLDSAAAHLLRSCLCKGCLCSPGNAYPPSLPAGCHASHWRPAGACLEGHPRLAGTAPYQHGGRALRAERAGGQAGRDRVQVSRRWRCSAPSCHAGSAARLRLGSCCAWLATEEARDSLGTSKPAAAQTGGAVCCSQALLYPPPPLQVRLSGADRGALRGAAAQHPARARLPGLLCRLCHGSHHRRPGAGCAACFQFRLVPARPPVERCALTLPWSMPGARKSGCFSL